MTNKYITDIEMVIVQRVAFNKKGFFIEFMDWTDLQQELYIFMLEKYDKVLEYREIPYGEAKLTRMLNNQADFYIIEEWIKFFPNLSSMIKTPKLRQIIKNNWDKISSYKLKNPKTYQILYTYYHTDLSIPDIGRKFNLDRKTIHDHVKQFEQDYLFKHFDRNQGKINISQIKMTEQGDLYA